MHTMHSDMLVATRGHSGPLETQLCLSGPGWGCERCHTHSPENQRCLTPLPHERFSACNQSQLCNVNACTRAHDMYS